MALRNIIQEVKEGVGGLSRRSFESRRGRLQQSSMEIQREDLEKNENEERNAVGWGNMMPELLTEIIERVEASQSVWPDRKNVVACACVCKSWRTITKHIVKPPHQCAKFTFPQALKQPGPLDPPMQCYIRRDKVTSTYYLYLGLTPTFADKGKFLLAARRFRHPVSTEYIISLDADDLSQGSNAYMGKLSSDFLGTKFTIYDSEAPHNGARICSNRAGRRVASKQVSPRVPAGSYNVGQVSYKFNLLGSRGPRRMHCALHSMACLSTILAESASTSKKTNEKDTSAISEVSTNNLETIELQGAKNGSMILKNKAPRWHEQLQCWCLNFHGRVTVASVKNFQLVAAVDPTRPGLPVDQDIVLLQFGKVGKDMFTMDYRQPLSAFQAFAICLTSFGTKLACE